MLKKSILPTLLVISFFACGLGISHASDVTFLGSTSGSFNGGGSSLLGLTYHPSGFNVTTATSSFASPFNMGAFTLDLGSSFNSGAFALELTFTVTTGVSTVATFTRTVFGEATDNGFGAIAIVFANNLQSFTYANVGGSGSFDFMVDNVYAFPGQTTNFIGSIQNVRTWSPPIGVPEPSTLLLLGAGLVGLAGIRRRKSD